MYYSPSEVLDLSPLIPLALLSNKVSAFALRLVSSARGYIFTITEWWATILENARGLLGLLILCGRPKVRPCAIQAIQTLISQSADRRPIKNIGLSVIRFFRLARKTGDFYMVNRQTVELRADCTIAVQRWTRSNGRRERRELVYGNCALHHF